MVHASPGFAQGFSGLSSSSQFIHLIPDSDYPLLLFSHGLGNVQITDLTQLAPRPAWSFFVSAVLWTGKHIGCRFHCRGTHNGLHHCELPSLMPDVDLTLVQLFFSAHAVASSRSLGDVLGWHPGPFKPGQYSWSVWHVRSLGAQARSEKDR